jgi:N-methylhydantoinase B
MARSVMRRTDGIEEIIPSKIVTRLSAGDRLVVETAGGGGYGEPKSRSPERIADDVANGKF